jgi:hypothetical protein
VDLPYKNVCRAPRKLPHSKASPTSESGLNVGFPKNPKNLQTLEGDEISQYGAPRLEPKSSIVNSAGFDPIHLPVGSGSKSGNGEEVRLEFLGALTR